MEGARRQLFDEMHETISAAIRLGTKKTQVAGILRGEGFSKDATRRLLSGRYKPKQFTNRYLGRAQERSRTLPISGAASSTDLARRRQLLQQLSRR